MLVLVGRAASNASTKSGLGRPMGGGGSKEVALMVNGINCEGCKAPLQAALEAIDGVTSVTVVHKGSSGAHPNIVKVSGADEGAVRKAIGEVDKGRNKYTVESVVAAS